jgi:hypothetical protein
VGSGGAIGNLNGTATLIGCTLASNHTDANGGAIYNVNSSSTITNAIVWGNSSQQGQVYNAAGGSASVSYTCVQGGWSGTGNVVSDPSLVHYGHWDDGGTPNDSADDDWVDGNYRLLGGSASIDAGNPSQPLVAGETDLDGHPRVLCNRVDMGAYERGIGDANCNGYIDAADFRAWKLCMTGPSASYSSPDCKSLDFDADGTISLLDYAGFQSAVDGG